MCKLIRLSGTLYNTGKENTVALRASTCEFSVASTNMLLADSNRHAMVVPNQLHCLLGAVSNQWETITKWGCNKMGWKICNRHASFNFSDVYDKRCQETKILNTKESNCNADCKTNMFKSSKIGWGSLEIFNFWLLCCNFIVYCYDIYDICA